MEYLAGAAAGLGASRYQNYAMKFDPDGGARYFRSGIKSSRRKYAADRRRVIRGGKAIGSIRARKIQRVFRKKRLTKKTQHYTKRSNQGLKKTIQSRPKRGMVKYRKPVQKSILYPNKATVTVWVGLGVTRSGSGANIILGNVNYRPMSESKNDDYSAWEIYDLCSLSGDSTTDNNQGAQKLLVGTQLISGTSTQAEILGAQDGASTSRSKILTNGVASNTSLLTLDHYVKCTGINNPHVNPNYMISGFSIDLQFQTLRQVDQMLCVRLVRVKQEALEDCWGQSTEGSDTLTGQNVANMVNSQYHINREKYEILYQCRTTLKGQQPASAQPKPIRVKKYIPCSYMSTRARKSWTASTSEYGGNMKPVYKEEDGRFNKCYCVVTVRPLSEQVLAWSQASNSGNFVGNYAGVAGSGSGAAGQKTSAAAYINGLVKTHYSFQSVLRLN